MSWLQSLVILARLPDSRPMRVVDQEILDELEFHIEMRTRDNLKAGMSDAEARQNAIERFGDFERIHKACRRTLLGERIMLQRIQAILTLVLLGAMVFLGIEFYRGQRANEAATAHIAELLERAAKQPAVVQNTGQTADAKKVQADVPKSVDRPKVVSVFPAPNASGVDPVTEIRIRFDRPMDPGKMGLYANPVNKPCPFHLRGSPEYYAETKEFVLPVMLKPNAKYGFSLERFVDFDKASDFRSVGGVAADTYHWQWATRGEAANPKASKPHVVSVDPPTGAQTGLVTAIRIQFDQPMNPDAYEPVGSIEDEGMKGEKVFVRLPIEYEASSRCFTFLAFFPRSTTAKIELRGFRGADGGEAEPVAVKYDVGKKLYMPEQEARVAEAGRLAKLHEVVDAVRRNWLALKSLEETVRTVSFGSNGAHLGWLDGLEVDYARYGIQGDRQFYADVSSIMANSSSPNIVPNVFRLGSDGRECWYYNVFQFAESQGVKEILFCPFDAMRNRKVVVGDPFGSKRFSSTEKAIQEMKLEYRGEVTREGRICHRVRSWEGHVLTNSAYAVYDWLIDARSLLPTTNDGPCGHYEFSYARVNEPIPPETFQSPTAASVPRKAFELEEGYDHFTLRASDGSDGRMSASWGQAGRKGGKDGGLN